MASVLNDNDKLRRAVEEANRRAAARQHPGIDLSDEFEHADPKAKSDKSDKSDSSVGSPESAGGDLDVKATRSKKRGMTLLLVIAVVLLLALIGLFVWFSSKSAEKDEQIEQLRLENQMIVSAQEFDAINADFARMESDAQIVLNDSLLDKYAAARAQVERLLAELQNERTRSAEQISRLQAEIETLRGILRDYTRQINELMEENEGLRQENTAVQQENRQLRQNVENVSRDNARLNERMTLAERLNVTNLTFQGLNRRDRNEKNITKAVKLEVGFTVTQNNSTPAGEHVIYLRIVSPEGDLLGNAGTFPFEGQQLAFTARKTIEYANEEIGGVTIYWDVNSTLTPGDYLVELFADNYRIASRTFTMRK